MALRKLEQEGSCEDVNECKEIPALCGHGDCVNLPGTYLCNCHQGFRLVEGSCEDINECREQHRESVQCGSFGYRSCTYSVDQQCFSTVFLNCITVFLNASLSCVRLRVCLSKVPFLHENVVYILTS